ncbi:unnamed protein product, partial [Amoebophrya sp. A120]
PPATASGPGHDQTKKSSAGTIVAPPVAPQVQPARQPTKEVQFSNLPAILSEEDEGPEDDLLFLPVKSASLPPGGMNFASHHDDEELLLSRSESRELGEDEIMLGSGGPLLQARPGEDDPFYLTRFLEDDGVQDLPGRSRGDFNISRDEHTPASTRTSQHQFMPRGSTSGRHLNQGSRIVKSRSLSIIDLPSSTTSSRGYNNKSSSSPKSGRYVSYQEGASLKRKLLGDPLAAAEDDWENFATAGPNDDPSFLVYGDTRSSLQRDREDDYNLVPADHDSVVEEEQGQYEGEVMVLDDNLRYQRRTSSAPSTSTIASTRGGRGVEPQQLQAAGPNQLQGRPGRGTPHPNRHNFPHPSSDRRPNFSTPANHRPTNAQQLARRKTAAQDFEFQDELASRRAVTTHWRTRQRNKPLPNLLTRTVGSSVSTLASPLFTNRSVESLFFSAKSIQTRRRTSLNPTEVEQLLRQRGRFVVHPTNKFNQLINLLTRIAMLYVTFVTPFEVVFLNQPSSILFICDRVVDGCFITHMFLQFFVMYKIPATMHGGDIWVTSHKSIVTNYLSTWFLIDFLAVFPWWALAGADYGSSENVCYMTLGAEDSWSGGSNSGTTSTHIHGQQQLHDPSSSPGNVEVCKDTQGSETVFLRNIRLLRLFELLRLARAGDIVQEFSSALPYPQAAQSLIKFIGVLLVSSHWLACIWAYLGLSYVQFVGIDQLFYQNKNFLKEPMSWRIAGFDIPEVLPAGTTGGGTSGSSSSLYVAHVGGHSDSGRLLLTTSPRRTTSSGGDVLQAEENHLHSSGVVHLGRNNHDHLHDLSSAAAAAPTRSRSTAASYFENGTSKRPTFFPHLQYDRTRGTIRSEDMISTRAGTSIRKTKSATTSFSGRGEKNINFSSSEDFYRTAVRRRNGSSGSPDKGHRNYRKNYPSQWDHGYKDHGQDKDLNYFDADLKIQEVPPDQAAPAGERAQKFFGKSNSKVWTSPPGDVDTNLASMAYPLELLHKNYAARTSHSTTHDADLSTTRAAQLGSVGIDRGGDGPLAGTTESTITTSTPSTNPSPHPRPSRRRTAGQEGEGNEIIGRGDELELDEPGSSSSSSQPRPSSEDVDEQQFYLEMNKPSAPAAGPPGAHRRHLGLQLQEENLDFGSIPESIYTKKLSWIEAFCNCPTALTLYEVQLCLKCRHDPEQLYAVSLYYALMTLTSIGYGDTGTAKTPDERFFGCVMMFLAGMLWTAVIGAACGVLANMDPSQRDFFQSIDELNKLINSLGLSNRLGKKLRVFLYKTRDLSRHENYKNLMQKISPNLQAELFFKLNSFFLLQVPCFTAFEQKLLASVCKKLKDRVLAQGEVFVDIQCLWILKRGLVLMDGKIFFTGRYWGDDVILDDPDLLRFYRGAALTYCECTQLSKQDLTECLLRYPMNEVEAKKFRAYKVKLAAMRGVINAARRKEFEMLRMKRFASRSNSSLTGTTSGAYNGFPLKRRNSFSSFSNPVLFQEGSHYLPVLKRSVTIDSYNSEQDRELQQMPSPRSPSMDLPTDPRVAVQLRGRGGSAAGARGFLDHDEPSGVEMNTPTSGSGGLG